MIKLLRHERPAEMTTVEAPRRTTDAVIAAGGRLFRPGARAGTVWCSGCGATVEAAAIRQHVCEVRR